MTISDQDVQAVDIKALEWESIDNTQEWAHCVPFWLLYRISLRSDRQKVLRAEWLGNMVEDMGLFDTWDAARAAAQSDLATRIDPLLALRSSSSFSQGYERGREDAAKLYDGDAELLTAMCSVYPGDTDGTMTRQAAECVKQAARIRALPIPASKETSGE